MRRRDGHAECAHCDLIFIGVYCHDNALTPDFVGSMESLDGASVGRPVCDMGGRVSVIRRLLCEAGAGV